MLAKLNKIEEQIKMHERDASTTNNYPFLEYGTKVVSPFEDEAKVYAIFVNEGDMVKKNDRLFLLERFKMEIEIYAPCDGVIEKIFVSKGDDVTHDEVLALIM